MEWRKAACLLPILAALIVSCGGSSCPPCPTCPAAGPAPAAGMPLEIVDQTFKRDTIGHYIAMGMLRNVTDAPVDLVRYEVSCTAFDADGHMVDTGIAYPEGDTVQPGEDVPFSTYLDETAPIESCECKAQTSF